MIIISEGKHLLTSVWKYGHFILAVSGELRARFPRPGALWFILHPLAQALMFLIIWADFVGQRCRMLIIRAHIRSIFMRHGLTGSVQRNLDAEA